MRAGDLRTRGTIETPVETPNDTGEPVVTWSPFEVVNAKVEELSGREQFTAQQDASFAQYRVTIRYLAGVSAKMRFRVGTQILDIEAVLPSERRDAMTLLCLERKVGT